VGAWKGALGEQGLAFLSLPTAAMDTDVQAMASVASAMRAHVPSAVWDQVIQIHQGGEALLREYSWQVDVFAKVLQVTGQGEVLAHHGVGPFSREALTAFLG
jgi:hypothetical protein